MEKNIQLPAVYKLEDNQDQYKWQFFKFGMRTILLIRHQNRTVTLQRGFVIIEPIHTLWQCHGVPEQTSLWEETSNCLTSSKPLHTIPCDQQSAYSQKHHQIVTVCIVMRYIYCSRYTRNCQVLKCHIHIL